MCRSYFMKYLEMLPNNTGDKLFSSLPHEELFSICKLCISISKISIWFDKKKTIYFYSDKIKRFFVIKIVINHGQRGRIEMSQFVYNSKTRDLGFKIL